MDYKLNYSFNGLIKSPEDKRDYPLKKILPLAAVKLPEGDYITEKIPFTYDQGKSSECCACAANYIRYLQEQNQSNIQEMFSPSFNYANRIDGEEFEGMYIRSCCKKLREGSVPWSLFPGFYSYADAKRIFLSQKQYLLEEAYPYRISSFYVCKTTEEIKMAIYTMKAVLIGVEVYDCLYKPDKDGYVWYNEETCGMCYGGHAMMIDSWKYDINGKLWWRVKNSWGEEYGDGSGYCWLPEDYPFVDDAYAFVDEVDEIKFKTSYKKPDLFTIIFDLIKKICKPRTL